MAVTRLDKIVGAHLESIQAPEVIKNGYFLQLGALVDGETELRSATKVVDNTKGNIVFHHTPEVDPDPRKSGLKHFEVQMGDAGRTYRLVEGDIITLTVDLFGTAPIVNDLVSPQNGEFLLDTSVGGEYLVLEVIQETSLGYDGDQAFVLSVVKA